MIVDWINNLKAWKVVDHEGRSRSDAAEILAPNKPMPVHIFPTKGMRARDLKPKMINARFIAQDSQ